VHRAPKQAEENDEDDHEETDIKVQLYLEDQNGRLLDFSEVGSGISYVMPILASLHGAKTSWVAQPELHLHPAAQCEMGDVFLRAFNRGHFSVVETHSEHMLLRMLRRIRQTTKGAVIDDDLKCPPEAISVLYFDPQEDGNTQVRQLRVSRLGDFKDRWPNGFFEERSRELFDE
jgi:predicted ATPase